MAFPALRSLRPLASAHPFASRPSPRVVEFNSTDTFISFNDLTYQQVKENPLLCDLKAIEPTLYLSHFSALPGLVKGITQWGADGQLAFSPDLKFFTRVCSSRVSGNRIKFNYGAEQILVERNDCYIFAVKRQRIDVVERYIDQAPADVEPLILLRDETDCRCCYTPLDAKNVSCSQRHQICADCFKLLPSTTQGKKKCPWCNVCSYTDEAYQKFNKILGQRVVVEKFLRINLYGANSFKEFINNEALFMGALRYITMSGLLSTFEKLMMSSFINFYHAHPDAYNTYNFSMTCQTSGNIRTARPNLVMGHQCPTPLLEYIEKADTPEIYNDVSNTDIYIIYDDIEFFNDLQFIDGNILRIKDFPNDTKRFLQREIFFRKTIARQADKGEFIINTFNKIIKENIINRASSHCMLYNVIREPQTESDAPTNVIVHV